MNSRTKRGLGTVGVLCALAGCTRGTTSAPDSHYYDALDNTLERLEPIYDRLQLFYGASMPARITVRYTDRDHSVFEPPTNSIGIALEHLMREGRAAESTIAHESSHLALYALTRGASALERFRFIDEGLAYILAARAVDRGESFRVKALAKAAGAHSQRAIDLDLVEAWDRYGSRQVHAENPHAYAVGASFVFFLLDRGGEPALRELLVGLGRSPDLDAALRATYGMSRQEAEAQWQDYLGRVELPRDGYDPDAGRADAD